MIGRTIAQYTILEKVGEGGMGEVWKARDTNLQREVAIKMLPEAFSQDAERLLRFEREAMLLAGLDHPGLATVYGLHDDNGARFLAMELVAGADLAQSLAAGPLPVQDALEIAVQVAAALEAAHDQGVVHRDLKPSNVMVTPEGKTKVLDFGLAFSISGESDSSGMHLSHSPTIAGPATGQGVILGTAAYMSPEQARGKPVDRRTDLWAFGCVLHEMLTGTMLFSGETVSDCVAKILTVDPDLDNLPPDTPVSIRKLIRRCLTRDVNQRQQGAGDARIVIEEALQGGGDSPETLAGAGKRGESPGKRRVSPWVLVAATAIGACLGALGWNLLSDSGDQDSSASSAKLSVVFPASLRVSSVELSPDGRMLAVSARPKRPATPDDELNGVYLRALDSFEFRFLEGSRGVTILCFSADGRWLVLVAPEEPRATRKYLWKVPVDGSAPPLKLVEWDPEWEGMHWLPDGDLIVGARGSGLVRIHTDGRPPEAPVSIHSEVTLERGVEPWPEHGTRLPDGEHLLSQIETWGDQGYSQDIVVCNVRTGETRIVMKNGSSPKWSDTGHLLFSRGSSLLAVPFDAVRLEVTGGATALADDLRRTQSWSHGWFDVAGNGSLIYAPGAFVGANRRLVWLDPQLNPLDDWSEDQYPLEQGPYVSPDGLRFVVVMAGDDGVYDIWMSATDRNILEKWVEEPGRDQVPRCWLPDGSGLLVRSRAQDTSRYYVQFLDRSRPPVFVFEDSHASALYSLTDFADDGAMLLGTVHQDGRESMFSIPVADAAVEAPQITTLLDNATVPHVSPDGRWLVYESDTSGRVEIYLRRWLGGGRLGPERRVSTEGGSGAEWRRSSEDGPLEIWYGSNSGVYSVVVGAGENPALPRPLLVGAWGESFLDVGLFHDGRLLLRAKGDDEGPMGHVNLVPGWVGTLERNTSGDE